MNTDELEHIRNVRSKLLTRQRLLELRCAGSGPRTPPEVVDELAEATAELARLDARIAQLEDEPMPPAAWPVPASQPLGINKAELRRRMLRYFDGERLELLCADLNERLYQAGQPTRISPALVGGVGLELVIQRLIDHLDRCDQLPLLLDTLREEQPGIL